MWAGVTSLQESVGRIVNPEEASYDAVPLVIVAVAVVTKIMLGLYTKRNGQKLNSGSLVASGTDALMDSIISAATLLAAIIFIFTGVSLEAWLGVIISLVIIKAGIDMLREVLSKIIGERIDPNLTAAIKRTVSSVEGVKGAYDLAQDDNSIIEVHGFYVDEDAKYASFDLVISFDAPDRHAEAAVFQAFFDGTFSAGAGLLYPVHSLKDACCLIDACLKRQARVATTPLSAGGPAAQNGGLHLASRLDHAAVRAIMGACENTSCNKRERGLPGEFLRLR